MHKLYLLSLLVLPLAGHGQATSSIAQLTITNDMRTSRAVGTSAATATPSAATAANVVSYAEEMPAFTGGSEAMHRYLVSKLVYPPEAIKRNVSGTVVVQFTVDEQGRVGEVEVARTSDPVFDAEAKRIMYTMPWWTPGREQGHPVKVRCTLPIIFTCKRAS